MARRTLHTARRAGLRAILGAPTRASQRHNRDVDIPRPGGRLHVLLHRCVAQRGRNSPADARKFLRFDRRPAGPSHRPEDAGGPCARRILGRPVVFCHLSGHRAEALAAAHTVHIGALGAAGHTALRRGRSPITTDRFTFTSCLARRAASSTTRPRSVPFTTRCRAREPSGPTSSITTMPTIAAARSAARRPSSSFTSACAPATSRWRICPGSCATTSGVALCR